MNSFFDPPDLTRTEILSNIGNYSISIGDRSHLQNPIKLIRCSKSGNKQKSISIDHKLYSKTANRNRIGAPSPRSFRFSPGTCSKSLLEVCTISIFFTTTKQYRAEKA